MSIRNFHNIFCPTCEKDTLHIALKCTECGAIVVTAAQQWSESKKVIRESPARRMRIGRNVAATREVRHQAAVERNQSYENFRHNVSGSRRTVFGGGRARKRA